MPANSPKLEGVAQRSMTRVRCHDRIQETMDVSESPNPARQPNILASFNNKDTLESALSYLEGEAIPRAQLSVRHAATAAEVPGESGDEPLREDEHRNLRTLRTSTVGVIGAFAAAGAVVATGGAALPALGAAAAAGLGAGGLSELAAQGASSKTRSQRKTEQNRQAQARFRQKRKV